MKIKNLIEALKIFEKYENEYGIIQADNGLILLPDEPSINKDERLTELIKNKKMEECSEKEKDIKRLYELELNFGQWEEDDAWWA